jgi:hypothetical protein
MTPRANDDARPVYRVFGVDIESATPLNGVRVGPFEPAPRVEVRVVPREAVDEPWLDVVRFGEQRLANGRVAFAIDDDPGRGYRIWGEDVGIHVVRRDGGVVLSAPHGIPDIEWQGWLLGQVLPLAATLHGFEPLHASAVRLDGRVLAFAGWTGTGKSSVALRLVFDGADLISDDVLALEAASDAVLAHHGHGMVGVRSSELETFSSAELGRLGAPCAQDGATTRFEMDVAECRSPLSALYLLERTEAAGECEFLPLPPLDPRPLLGNSFVHVVRTPERLARQLGVAAAMAQHCAVVRVLIAPNTTSSAVAAAVADHAARKVAA